MERPIAHITDADEFGLIADRQIGAKHKARDGKRLRGEDLDAVLECAHSDAMLSPLVAVITAAHKERDHVTSQ